MRARTPPAEVGLELDLDDIGEGEAFLGLSEERRPAEGYDAVRAVEDHDATFDEGENDTDKCENDHTEANGSEPLPTLCHGHCSNEEAK
jgi:hypothetical protein